MKTITKSLVASLAISAATLSGCYVVPVVDPQGNVQYLPQPLPPSGTQAAGAYPAYPVMLQARLYPANEAANQTGVVRGTVANMRTGKGRFQLNYQGETLVGEATRHGPDDKHGVASAYGAGGTYMQCEYQMNTAVQGAGTCTFSSGARYTLHIGS